MPDTLSQILDAAAGRQLPCLLIGGNALILLGYIRNTLDLDFLVEEDRRSAWLEVMRKMDYRLFNGTAAFAQFEAGPSGGSSVDLMFVDAATWNEMWKSATSNRAVGREVFLPKPEHLLALKLHAAVSPTRSKPETDWEDIRQIVRICRLDVHQPALKKMVLRYGGEKAWERVRLFTL